MRYALLIALVFTACGDIASTDSTTSNSQDNSVDNSQHGISSCTHGSTLVCREQTPDDQGGVGSVQQTVECVNVNGDPVVLSGPEPVNGDVNDACPKGEAVIIPAE